MQDCEGVTTEWVLLRLDKKQSFLNSILNVMIDSHTSEFTWEFFLESLKALKGSSRSFEAVKEPPKGSGENPSCKKIYFVLQIDRT